MRVRGVGVWFAGHRVGRSDIALVIEAAENHADVPDIFRQHPVEVFFSDTPVPCDVTVAGKCSGLGGEQIDVWLDSGCLARSTFLHELTHDVLWNTRHDYDSLHEDVATWQWADSGELLPFLAGCD